MPPAEPIPQHQLTAFSAERDRVFASFAPPPVPSVPAVRQADDVAKNNGGVQ
jgi:hypothetical protein